MNPIQIQSLPFYWRVRGSHEPNIVADRFPFSFTERPELGLLSQTVQPAVVEALDIVYKANANIGYLQDGNPLAAAYGGDLLRFVRRHLAGVKGAVAEIGCGGCYMLEALQRDGFEVIGVDPSPLAARSGAAKGIPILQTFYPSPSFTERFSAIVHMNVLEHVIDPVIFLRSHLDNLVDGGLLIVGVPDCTENIARGDVSMAMHEHFSYFDEKSLGAVAEAAGFQVVEIVRSGYGGSLYASLTPGSGTRYTVTSRPVLSSFSALASAVVERIDTFFGATSSIGIYVPLRALPYISLLGLEPRVRLFDDAQHWHNQFFDGLDMRIENAADLQARPVEKLLIASLTFGNQIAARLTKNGSSAMQISNLSAFL